MSLIIRVYMHGLTLGLRDDYEGLRLMDLEGKCIANYRVPEEGRFGREVEVSDVGESCFQETKDDQLSVFLCSVKCFFVSHKHPRYLPPLYLHRSILGGHIL